MDWSNNLRIRQAAAAVHRGGVIAYPTEAVWGLGCDPLNRAAVDRLLSLKQRPVEKGLILVAANLDQLEPFIATLSDQQLDQIGASWPGPVTWLIPASELTPAWIKGKFQSVGVRVSAHPLVKALCLAVGRPIVSTSANPASLAPAKSALRVRHYFPQGLSAITPGKVGDQKNPSEIRDLLTAKVIRNA